MLTFPTAQRHGEKDFIESLVVKNAVPSRTKTFVRLGIQPQNRFPSAWGLFFACLLAWWCTVCCGPWAKNYCRPICRCAWAIRLFAI